MYKYTDSQEINVDEEMVLPDPELTKNDKTMVRINQENTRLRANHDISSQINQIIETNEGVWICKLCEESSSSRLAIRRHAEIHIEGMSFACHICSKILSNRNNLNIHISRIHSQLFSCDICKKSGMNKMSLYNHKIRKH